jgi:putative transposase
MAFIFHKHPRLRHRDYTRGTYFLTISTERRGEILGRITGRGADARMELNDAGRIVEECFREIPLHHPAARIAEVQLMPDHLHAILVLEPKKSVDEGGKAGGEEILKSTQWVEGADARDRNAGAIVDAYGRIPGEVNEGRPSGPKRGSLGAIMAAFKSASTKQINALPGRSGGRFWKKGFHEWVVREQAGEYERIAQYIANDPEKWTRRPARPSST